MNILDKVIKELTERSKKLPHDGIDLSDVGNEVGVIVAQYFSDTMGHGKNDFIDGIKHGISLMDGTHSI